MKTKQSPLPESGINHRVKLMCSYGGKINLRPHDNHLTYVGGDTKILTIHRNIKFSNLLSNLSSLINTTKDAYIKYQLPGEDLDTLISVIDEEDLEHMMVEYNRLLHLKAPKPAHLRLFLFPLNPKPKIPRLPDFLFEFDERPNMPEFPVNEEASPSPASSRNDFLVGSQVLSRGQQIREQSTAIAPEIQRQIHEFQKLQIAAAYQEQQTPIHQRKKETRAFSDTANASSIAGDCHLPRRVQEEQNRFEKIWPLNVTAYGGAESSANLACAVLERQLPGTDQPLYMIPAGSGVYPANSRPVASLMAGHGFYPTPRMVSSPNYYVPQSYRDPAGFYGLSRVGAYGEDEDDVGSLSGWNVADTRHHEMEGANGP